MQEAYQRQVESVIHYRRQLAEVEARRAHYPQAVPEPLWQELADVSHRLEQAEQRVRQTCQDVAAQVNQARAAVTALLSEYNAWRERMRQAEELFLANILRPGQHLKQAVHQRQALQHEYQRMRAAIQREGYPDQQALEADIRQVLTRGDLALDAQTQPPQDEPALEEAPAERLARLNVDDLLEAISREELVKEFKRVVLPAIHPDTSHTSPEVFKTVFEVYKKGDWLLMEAYILEYRGQVEAERDSDPLECLDELLKTQQRCQHLLQNLGARVERLKADLTAEEVEDPEKLRQNLLRQRQEILARIQSEAEGILDWRAKIEGLVEEYHQRHNHPWEEE